MNDRIIFEDVSKFYGEVLGVNRISLSIPPGITTLVGPNGSGKTTIMNLMTDWFSRPADISLSARDSRPPMQLEFFAPSAIARSSISFRAAFTGWQFVFDSLMLHGMKSHGHVDLTLRLSNACSLAMRRSRKIAGYSKGMRQKIRLAQAIAHHPRVLVLDEPLNGLDPMARAESIALFEELGRQGMHVLISSHILDEVDRISDRVILITGGYLIAEGNIHQVRQEVHEKPMQVLIRCDHPELLASKMFSINHCVEARLHADGKGVFLRTADIDQFYSMLNGIAARAGQDRCGRAGRRRCQRHLPISDRHRWERLHDAAQSNRAQTFVQQPWGLWWMQAQRLTRIELRRNLFSWKATWIYFPRFHSPPSSSSFIAGRSASSLRDERRYQHAGRHHPASITSASAFSSAAWESFRGSFAER
jgi:ABC-2 type transport system ATP-binding protein